MPRPSARAVFHASNLPPLNMARSVDQFIAGAFAQVALVVLVFIRNGRV